jgi:hypothetical protein
MTDGTVWLSIGQGLLFGAVCLLFGIWAARFVGLLPSDAPTGETIGVGLASGLLVLAAWWAAVASSGRSSFTPVAVGFAIAIALAIARWRSPADVDAHASASITGNLTNQPPDMAAEAPASRSARRRTQVVGVLSGAAFIIAVALVYGSTLTPSQRDSVQPLEFNDEAYYSILGADLARTGTESLYSPSGFDEIEGLPVQTWYHWGEAWLGAAVITIFGVGPLQARHLIVLPILLLAAAALTGTLVRRMTGSSSRGAFLFGLLACLFLAPAPLAAGMIFEIRLYGLAAVAVLLSMYSLAVLGRRRASWALSCFVGSAAALILPAHIVIAVLALVGVGSVWTTRVVQSLVDTRRLPVMAPVWRRTYVATGIALLATVGWGALTGHGIGTSGLSPSVSPFNAFWRESVAITIVGAGAFLAIAIAWFMVRNDRSIEAGLYLGTAVLLVTGALVWGARLADFNTIHLFYGGIAVFATPVAAVAVASIWLRLRATGHARLAVAAIVLGVAQIELSVAMSIVRLQGFGPGSYPPVPVGILATIRGLPSYAKLAYACLPFEEPAFWDPRLLGIGAHTGRRIVPMCFQADLLGAMISGQMSADIPSPLFRWAPQRLLYPDSGAQPSAASVASFLKANGIGYIYVDRVHPNSLVPDAIPIATSGQTQVLRIQ